MNELVVIGAISPLRQRLIDDMTMRRFGEVTQRNYIRDVGRFATWLGRSPHTATAEDLRRFQIEQQEAGLPVPTMNTIVSALRFFFTHTLDRPELARKLILHPRCPKADVALPNSDGPHLDVRIATPKSDVRFQIGRLQATEQRHSDRPKIKIPIADAIPPRGFGLRRLSDASRRPKL